MNLLKRVETVYEKDLAHRRRKAPVLMGALISALVLSVIGVCFLVATATIDEGIPILVSLCAVLSVCSVLLLKGRFDRSVTLLVWSTATLFVVMLFVAKNADLSHYIYGCLSMMVPFFLQALFSSDKVKTISLLGFCTVSLQLLFWLRLYPAKLVSIFSWGTSSLFLLFSGLMTFLIVTINELIRGEMDRSAQDAQERSVQLGSLVQSSRRSLSVGSELQSTARGVKAQIDQIMEHIRFLESEIDRMQSHELAVRDINDRAEVSFKSVTRSLSRQKAAFYEAEKASGRILDEASLLEASAKENGRVAGELVQQAATGRDALDRGVRSVKELIDFAQEMENVVSVIEDVAGRTSLLAMNASIEAAHAGPAGRGFAVVAGEIGKLAQEADRNSRHIKDTLGKTRDLIVVAGEANCRVVSIFDLIGQWVGQVSRGMVEFEQRAKRFSQEADEMSRRTEDLKAANLEVAGEVEDLDQRLRSGVSAMEGLNLAVEQVGRRAESVVDEASGIGVHMEKLERIGQDNMDHVSRQTEFADRIMAAISVRRLEISDLDTEKPPANNASRGKGQEVTV